MSRQAKAFLSSDHLIHNIKVLRQKSPHSEIIAMLKANGYGHGLRSTATRIAAHIDRIGVASIDEALALRQVGIRQPIVLMEGAFEKDELEVASRENFEVVFHEPNQLTWLQHLTRPLCAWLKVDTGMGRLGFDLEYAQQAFDTLIQHPHIKSPLKVISHLACAHTPQHPLNAKQIQLFATLSKTLKTQHPCQFSLCNSPAIFHFPEHHYDMVRAGAALYGLSPHTELPAKTFNLKPVMTLKTTIIAIRNIPAGHNIGYGGHYTSKHPMRIGVIACGYGDGYPCTTQDTTPVRIRDRHCPIIGKISMDMTSIDLHNCPQARVGDEVILWGDALPVEEVATALNRSPYELLTNIQYRVKFIWT